jgi:hypothetical protein
MGSCPKSGKLSGIWSQVRPLTLDYAVRHRGAPHNPGLNSLRILQNCDPSKPTEGNVKIR